METKKNKRKNLMTARNNFPVVCGFSGGGGINTLWQVESGKSFYSCFELDDANAGSRMPLQINRKLRI